MTYPEFSFESEAESVVPLACIKQRQLKIERMLKILTYALSWVVSGFGNRFKLDKSLRVKTIGVASYLCYSGKERCNVRKHSKKRIGFKVRTHFVSI